MAGSKITEETVGRERGEGVVEEGGWVVQARHAAIISGSFLFMPLSMLPTLLNNLLPPLLHTHTAYATAHPQEENLPFPPLPLTSPSRL